MQTSSSCRVSLTYPTSFNTLYELAKILCLKWIINEPAFYVKSNKSIYKVVGHCEKQVYLSSSIKDNIWTLLVSYAIAPLLLFN